MLCLSGTSAMFCDMFMAQLCLPGTSALSTACQIRGLQSVSFDPTPGHVRC
jgi:hypothetical protein